MLYFAIDQHSKQLTVSIRDEEGRVTVRRQVSTRPDKVEKFLEDLEQESRAHGGYVAIVEVCGMNDWLIDMLRKYGCQQVVLVQPDRTSKKKTDRRDANQLGELLWVNRQRLLAGQKVQGLRRVYMASQDDLADRQLTAARARAARQRTRTINRIKALLRRHNLMWHCPTKTFGTQGVRRWLAGLSLGSVDRLELDHLLAQWNLWDEQIEALGNLIVKRCEQNQMAQLLMTIVGVSYYMALAFSSRINDIERFPRARSLANYWGLTPGCRNSGEKTDRLGSITKEGSAMARFMLGQLVVHVLRRDGKMRGWYQRIKRRRGSKIARVAVMRRLATIFWHMIKYKQPYRRARVTGSCPQTCLDPEFVKKHHQQLRESLGITQKGSPRESEQQSLEAD